MTRKNALWNCRNPHQGSFKKVLTVCSAGLLRSPTIAWYLTKHTDFNCRAAGVHDYALVELDDVLIDWADLIICSEDTIKQIVDTKYKDALDYSNKTVLSLQIPDSFAYRDPELVKIIEEKLKELNIVNPES